MSKDLLPANSRRIGGSRHVGRSCLRGMAWIVVKGRLAVWLIWLGFCAILVTEITLSEALFCSAAQQLHDALQKRQKKQKETRE